MASQHSVSRITPATSARRSPSDRRDAGQAMPLPKLRARLGWYQLTLSALTATTLIICWPLGASDRLSWGPLLVGVLGGIAGSLVHTMTVFSSRVGRDTFEASYAWWYVLRPFAAALLALLFVALVLSGVVAYTSLPADQTPVLPFVAGGLAGLFTDTVLQTLRALLGATNTEVKASDQHPPLTPEASPVTKP